MTNISSQKQKNKIETNQDIPNSETLSAFQEVETMRKYPSIGKAYTDVDLIVVPQIK